MKNLKVNSTPKTPEVYFGAKKGYLEMSGISVPEDSLGFYNPLISWLKEYAINPSPTTNFTFKLAYINTSSLQALYDILFLLDEIDGKTSKVIVNWYYLKDDDDMKEVGEDLQEALSSKFSFFAVDDV
ncbi:MAG: DUF1987 domain-containing protein [Vicingaceae bacterium]|nr:DUF1987 domain-containing protein [Vicingaceae bacterium]